MDSLSFLIKLTLLKVSIFPNAMHPMDSSSFIDQYDAKFICEWVLFVCDFVEITTKINSIPLGNNVIKSEILINFTLYLTAAVVFLIKIHEIKYVGIWQTKSKQQTLCQDVIKVNRFNSTSIRLLLCIQKMRASKISIFQVDQISQFQTEKYC